MGKGKRLHYMDIAKGILILLLIEHHRGHIQSYNGIDTSMFDMHLGNWQLMFICFFMQAFFFISGYCSNFKKPAKNFVWTQVKGILIPTIFFQIGWCIFFSLNFATYTWKQDILNIPNTTYWFLIALFFSKIIVYTLNSLEWSDKKVLIVTFGITTIGLLNSNYNIIGNYLAFNQILMACFYVALGHYMNKEQNIYNKCLEYSITLFPWAVLILIMFKRDIPYATGAVNCQLQYIPIFFLLTLSGTFALLYICRLIGHMHFLEYVGRNSLIVYGFHYCVAIYVSNIIWTAMVPQSLVQIGVYILILLLSVTLLCVLLIYICKYKPISWILGKW